MSEWKPFNTAPKTGEAFLALRGCLLSAIVEPSNREWRAVLDAQIVRREWATDHPSGEGYWVGASGSIADRYFDGALWAPLDALPLADLFRGENSQGVIEKELSR